MQNWAFGIVEVSGTRAEIESFIGRFISDDDPPTIAGKRYFARSFLNEERQTCIDEAMKTCECFADDALVSCSFPVQFAWSAYSCMVEGYPQHHAEACLTLGDACVEDHVSVKVRTSETGLCFEECITCDLNGNIDYEEHDLSKFKCSKCGEVTHLSSFEDPDEQECPNCGEAGLESYTEE